MTSGDETYHKNAAYFADEAGDSAAEAAASAALATSVVNLTDKDDSNTLYAMAWSIEDGFPVLTLTERT